MIRRFLEGTINNAVFANILMVLVLISGAIGLFTMVREIIPSFSLNTIAVTVPFPGADPDEVEEGICLKLEEALEGIDDVREVRTTAAEGVGSAIIECEDKADVREVRDEVVNRIDAITTFPQDAEEPSITEVKIRGDVLGIAVWGDLPEHQLKEVGLKLKDDLLALDEVSQVSLSGVRNYEVSIEIAEGTLREYGLTIADVSRALARNSLNVPGGLVRTSRENIRIRSVGRRYTAVEYRSIPIISRSDGTVIELGDIARVVDAFDEDVSAMALFNGKPSISLDVLKTENEDSIRISNAVHNYIERARQELPDTVNLTIWRDSSRFVEDRLNMLVRNGKIGLCLVFVALWLFLDIRLSFWVAMGIPISLAGGLALMGVCGETLNMLSLFGLIMVLGLIVDDAIVVGESIYVHRRRGEDSRSAAIMGACEVSWPVIAAVTTTVVAFMPLFFVSGVMGKFIQSIPVPVIAALLVSLVECLVILPVHLRHLPDLEHREPHGVLRLPILLRRSVSLTLEWCITHAYAPVVRKATQWRYVTVTAAFVLMLVTIGLLKGGIVKFVFFPETDSDFLMCSVELPAGTPLSKTKAVANNVLAAWWRTSDSYSMPEGKHLTVAEYTLVGDSLQLEGGASGDHQFELYIELMPSEERNIYYQELVEKWKDEVGSIPGAVRTEFASTERGPGGKPIEIMLLSNNESSLINASEELKEKLKTLVGVYDIQSTYEPGKLEYQVRLKPAAHTLGITLADVATHIRQGYYGDEAVRLQRGRDDVKVKIRYPEKGGRDTIEFFKRQRIRTPTGDYIPLTSLATIDTAPGFSIIQRQDKKRTVTVSADVQRDGANAKEIVDTLEASYLPTLARKYRQLNFSTKGQTEQMRESLDSLKLGFPLALIGIYLIIATIFRSYLQPLVIMITIPFGLIGAVYGHMLFDMPLTMLSFFGMVALAGIVVNDAIVLIEAINVRLASGMGFFEALEEGGKRRFRAIFLTTLTTFAGLTPLMLETSMQAQFLIPMAIAIAFGVVFATFVTLLVIPSLLVIMNDGRRAAYCLWNQKWPTRLAVEPGARRENTPQDSVSRSVFRERFTGEEGQV